MPNLGTVLAEATMRASVEILRTRGLATSDLDIDALCVHLRRETKNAITKILAEGEEMIDANVGEAWLKKRVSVECCLAASRAIDALLKEND